MITGAIETDGAAGKRKSILEKNGYPDIGAVVPADGRTLFRVWAPNSKRVSVKILTGDESRLAPLQAEGWGYFSSTVEDVWEGDRYLFVLDDATERPDPASRHQPEGVHGPSQVVDHCGFTWTDNGWSGLPLEEYVIYELHVGTFTEEGTFEAVIPRLDHLAELGVTAVELMPVAQFSGERNWGYDGVYPFAPHCGYGGPAGMRKLVDACHGRGLAVVLDVVYNHLGPEGNYLHAYGPYFTDRYRTPWGDAVNLDGPYSDEVRSFFFLNALHWLNEYHMDALRLDAVHGIFDFSARHFLEQLATEVRLEAKRLGRKIYVIAESDLNDVRLINKPNMGGYGLDAQWNDDFHHSLHTLLTGEEGGYYVDFGGVGRMAKAIRERFVYSGDYSRYRRRRHGNSARGRPPGKFVVFAQNHDQVGNRMFGDRLASLVSFESLKLAAAMVLLSPYVPLLFMGEEYGEETPFLYFVDHSDPALVEAVGKGRREEFKQFVSSGEPPDPGSIETFIRSKPDFHRRLSGNQAALLHFYRKLIEMRKKLPALGVPERQDFRVFAGEKDKLLLVERWMGGNRLLCLFNFNDQRIKARFFHNGVVWRKLLDSSDTAWNGPGALLPEVIRGGTKAAMEGRSCAVFEMG